MSGRDGRASDGRYIGRRLLTLAVLVYLTVDLTDPLLPGAFNFDPDTSVEIIVTRAHGLGATTPTLARPIDRATSVTRDHEMVPARPTIRPQAPRARPLVHAHLRAPISDPGSPSEDH